MPNVDEDTAKKIWDHYQKGQGSLQDLARIYRVGVDDVLEIIKETELSTVALTGDLIDPSDVGPGGEFNHGKQVKVPYTVN